MKKNLQRSGGVSCRRLSRRIGTEPLQLALNSIRQVMCPTLPTESRSDIIITHVHRDTCALDCPLRQGSFQPEECLSELTLTQDSELKQLSCMPSALFGLVTIIRCKVDLKSYACLLRRKCQFGCHRQLGGRRRKRRLGAQALITFDSSCRKSNDSCMQT